MDKNFYKNYFNFEANHWWSRVRRELVFDLINSFSKNKDNRSVSIFDYGCASGILVKELQLAGFDSHGGDIAEEAISFGLGNDVKNLSVVYGDKTPHPENKFDFVLALDLLEHLPDESAVMKEMHRILKPGGAFIIFVPAFHFLWGVQDEIAHHYRRYTLNGLLAIKGMDKFKVVRKSYFNTFLFGPIAAVRLISRLFKIKKRESDFDLNDNFLNSALYRLFKFERPLLKFCNFPFGVSILLILEKK